MLKIMLDWRNYKKIKAATDVVDLVTLGEILDDLQRERFVESVV